jgi:hypothetical protein
MRWCLPYVDCGPVQGSASPNCHQNTLPSKHAPNCCSRVCVCVCVTCPVRFMQFNNTSCYVVVRRFATCKRCCMTKNACRSDMRCAVCGKCTQPTHLQQSPACLHTQSIAYRNGSESFCHAVGQFVRTARHTFCTRGVTRTGK